MRPPRRDTAAPDAAPTRAGQPLERAGAERRLRGRRDGAGARRQPDDQATGKSRTFIIRMPTGYDGKRALPVMFAFHGAGGGAAAFEKGVFGTLSKMAADKAVRIFPQAFGGNTWSRDEDDDVKFMDALIAWLGTKVCYDTARVFAVGQSSGSYFSHRFACDRGNIVRAVATNSGGQRKERPLECKIAGVVVDLDGAGRQPRARDGDPAGARRVAEVGGVLDAADAHHAIARAWPTPAVAPATRSTTASTTGATRCPRTRSAACTTSCSARTSPEGPPPIGRALVGCLLECPAHVVPGEGFSKATGPSTVMTRGLADCYCRRSMTASGARVHWLVLWRHRCGACGLGPACGEPCGDLDLAAGTASVRPFTSARAGTDPSGAPRVCGAPVRGSTAAPRLRRRARLQARLLRVAPAASR